MENYIPLLFKILFGFVALNTLINAILFLTRPRRINKLLSVYWLCLFLLYLFQGQFNSASNFVIVLTYSVGYTVSILMGMIAFEAIGKQFPIKNYLFFMFPFYPLTYGLDLLGYGFTTVAMPFAIMTAIPVLHGSYYLFSGASKSSTPMQKILGVIYFLQALHCINFALFRMEQGAQLWGWIVSYVLCDLMAILLPSIALEQVSLSEEERLQRLVDEKTQALSRSLKTNETLLKVLIHDISNPLTTMKGYLYLVRKSPEKANYFLEKIEKTQNAIDQIFFQIRDLYQGKEITMKVGDKVSIDECFQEVAFIFEQALRNKDIFLRFVNELTPETFAKANPVTLTHNVLSNLLSNSLKFAPPHSEIVITAREEDGSIILEVQDSGAGIPRSVLQRLNCGQDLESSQGTMGEVGLGFGLTIVKSFVNSFGGEIEFDSAFMHEQARDYGTKVRITLDRA